MSSITTNLRNEHRNCDEIFSEAERAELRIILKRQKKGS